MNLPIVILAAGRGTRMKHLSQDKPKHLIEVNGQPFLSYVLDHVYEAGASDVFLVVGYQSQAMYEFVKKSNLPNLHIINQFERLGEERYGTLIPIEAVKPELEGSSFLVVSGDNLYSVRDLQHLITAKRGAIAAIHHTYPERYGVLVARDDGTLETIIEKPEVPPSHLINTGLYHLPHTVWNILPDIQPSTRGEYELTEALTKLAKQEPIDIITLQDYWLDFGRPEDIPIVEKVLG